MNYLYSVLIVSSLLHIGDAHAQEAKCSQAGDDAKVIAEDLNGGRSKEEGVRNFDENSRKYVDTIDKLRAHVPPEKIGELFYRLCMDKERKTDIKPNSIGGAPKIIDCAAVSVLGKLNSNFSAISSMEAQKLTERAPAWFKLYELHYGSTAPKKLSPNQVAALSPSNLRSLVIQCNADRLETRLSLAAPGNAFLTDPRWHAEACMAILSIAEEKFGDKEGAYSRARQRAYSVQEVLATQGVGEEGGTRVFRWITERNGGAYATVRDIKTSDVKYCSEYYSREVRVVGPW